MYQTTFNNSKYEIDNGGDEFLVNGNPLDWDIISVGKNKFHIIYKERSYNAELIAISEDKKEVSLKLDNNIYKVAVKNKFDQLLEKLGMTDLASSKLNDVKAPMPGLILSIEVNIGDELKKGDKIMILEAMKMENMLKSPGEGVVKEINVKEGDSVEKNAVLVKF
jgi:biotin carboxyl carrier protein